MRQPLAEAMNVTIDGQTLRRLLKAFLRGEIVDEFDRQTILRTLEVALLDHATYEWYLTQLAIATNANYDNLDSNVDEQTERAVNSGLDSLVNEEFRQLVTNPVAIIQLAEELNNSDTEPWRDLKTRIGREMLRSAGRTIPTPESLLQRPAATGNPVMSAHPEELAIKSTKAGLQSTALSVSETGRSGTGASQIRIIQPQVDSSSGAMQWWPDVAAERVPTITLKLELTEETRLYVAFLDEASGNPFGDPNGFATWIGVWATRDFVPPDDSAELTEGGNVRLVSTESAKGERKLKSVSPGEEGDVLALYLTNSEVEPGSWERLRILLPISSPVEAISEEASHPDIKSDSSPASTELSESAVTYLAKERVELLCDLGVAVYAIVGSTPPSTPELVKRAKAWLEKNQSALRTAACASEVVSLESSTDELYRELTRRVAEVIRDIPAELVAALLVKEGIRKFCGLQDTE